ncbi:hypothetical protein EVAR_25052_1 [Eumeta japonica]|uniref:Uncharacterized protein n=1 Tax=Eumeta variegata TaxID=151549 RepID=A0A4C1V720_EUMVA|nr:hypothetical protein EVAR_25052_1 [Eumeta japonica]
MPKATKVDRPASRRRSPDLIYAPPPRSCPRTEQKYTNVPSRRFQAVQFLHPPDALARRRRRPPRLILPTLKQKVYFRTNHHYERDLSLSFEQIYRMSGRGLAARVGGRRRGGHAARSAGLAVLAARTTHASLARPSRALLLFALEEATASGIDRLSA